jgi:hypothetical protein
LRDALEQNRPWLESLAQQIVGRKIAVAGAQADAAANAPEPGRGGGPGGTEAAKADRKAALKEQALADAGVQALLEVFPAEIRDVEEM